MTNYSLFLDDIRAPKDVHWADLPNVHWTIVRDYKAFVNMIKARGIPSRVAFDHDLAEEHYGLDWNTDPTPTEKTGMDCVKFLVEECMKANRAFPEYYLHTLNNCGRENMKSYIKQYQKHFNLENR